MSCLCDVHNLYPKLCIKWPATYFLKFKKSSQLLTMHFKPAKKKKKNDCRGWKAVLSSIRLLVLTAQLWNCRFQEEDKNCSQNLWLYLDLDFHYVWLHFCIFDTKKGDSLITGGVKTVWPFYESSFHISVHNCPLWTVLVSCDEFIGHDSVKKRSYCVMWFDWTLYHVKL